MSVSSQRECDITCNRNLDESGIHETTKSWHNTAHVTHCQFPKIYFDYCVFIYILSWETLLDVEDVSDHLVSASLEILVDIV